MTRRQWLAEMRRPDMCGINARAYLKGLAQPRGRAIDRKIALNAIDSAMRRLCDAMAASRSARHDPIH